MQECSKPILDGFCIASKGVWYLARTLEKFIDPEVTSYVTELNLQLQTVFRSIKKVTPNGRRWLVVVVEEALSDKSIRSKMGTFHTVDLAHLAQQTTT
jgi:hypothetical protein